MTFFRGGRIASGLAAVMVGFLAWGAGGAQAQDTTNFSQGAQNGLASPAAGITGYTWNNAANWSNGIPLSNSTTVVDFGAAVGILGSTFNTLDDLSGATTLNQFNFSANGNGTATASAISVNILGGNSINFAGTSPALNLSAGNAANVTITGNLTVGASTTFNNASGQTLTLTGGVNLGTSTLTVTGTPYASGNVIFGAGGIMTGTTGSLVVGGGNFATMYQGNVTISTAVANTFTGGVTVASGTLTVDSSNALTAAIAGAGLLASANPLTLGSSSSYTGGTITFKADAGAASNQTLASLTLAEGQNQITMTVNGTSTQQLTFGNTTWTRSNFATINLTAPATTLIAAPSQVSSTTLVTAPWITLGAANFVFLSGAGNVTAQTYAAGVQNQTTWTQTGPGVDQQYTTGTVSMTTSGAYANSLNFTPAAITILELPNGSTSTISTGGIMSGLGAFAKTIQPLTGTATIVPGGAEWVIQNTTVAGNLLNINVVMGDGSSPSNLTIGGASTGVTVLGASNTFTGNVTINTGELRLGIAGALPTTATFGGTGTVLSTVQINYGGILSLGFTPASQANLNSLVGQIASTSSGVFAINQATSLNISMANFPNLSFGASTSSAYTGTLTPNSVSGVGSFGTTYTGQYLLGGGGGGQLTMSNTNALTGSNQLIFSNNGATATNVVLSAANNYTGGTVLAGSTGTLTATAGPSGLGSGGITFANSNTLAISASGTLSQNILINDNFTATFNAPTASTTVILSGAISGSGNVAFTAVNGANAIYALNTAATYGGSTTIGNGGATSGYLQLGVANTLPVLTEVSMSVTTATALFNLNGNSQQIGGLFATVTTGSSTVQLGSGGATLTIQNVLGTNFAGVISGAGNVIINAGFYTNTALGAFTQTFSAANPFTGTLTLNSGTLSVSAANQLGSGTGLYGLKPMPASWSSRRRPRPPQANPSWSASGPPPERACSPRRSSPPCR